MVVLEMEELALDVRGLINDFYFGYDDVHLFAY